MGRTVLICDDAAFARASLRQLLTREGYDVVGEAENGEEAIAKHQTLRPDVTTMDVIMPGVGGLDALREILKENAQARIVMCTAMGQERLIADAVRDGAKGVVVKPYTREQVLKAVESALA